MSLTDKYDLEKVDYGTEGWNAIMTANMEKLDALLHTYLEGELSVAVSAFEAGYIGPDGKWGKAVADPGYMPAMGLAIEAGTAEDTIRFQRVGPITNVAWSWTPGLPVYLSSAVPGGMTQVKPDSAQIMGVAISATTVILAIQIPDLTYSTTTTTTTTV